jgi:hypothetical protein
VYQLGQEVVKRRRIDRPCERALASANVEPSFSPDLAGVSEDAHAFAQWNRQWVDVVAPYWADLAAFANTGEVCSL